jgi:ubiquinone/menaquinone biosynthesis C-methylase UbiE
MVDTAQLNLKEAQKAIKGTLNFQVGDVQKLNLNKKFDIAITERTLQNLSTFNDQINAIRSISDHLKPGGKFLMVECSTSSVNKINKKLSHLNRELIDPMPWHNLFFHDNELIQNVEKKSSLKLKKIDRFSSNYIYVTRIMRKVWQERLFRFGFRNFIWKIPQIGDWGYFKLYIWEKSCD